MKTLVHQSKSRGHFDHGWLNTYHTFSFGQYYSPERMQFGVLRVLNDDIIAPGTGFGEHPHNNMEIISIPISGELKHKDSMGNVSIINAGDIQVMSAGTGIRHSEFNSSKTIAGNFLQIWILPNQQNVEPRYDQIKIEELSKPNQFYQILSPNPEDTGVWIHQNAWFSMCDLSEGNEANYSLKNSQNGVYLFIIDGEIQFENEILEKRDGAGIWETDSIKIKATKSAKILLMEVPLNL